MKKIFALLVLISCNQKQPEKKETVGSFILVLGNAQDAGYPQIGCVQECCKAYWQGKENKKFPTCLALVDSKAGQYWLIEATPDIKEQLYGLQAYLPKPDYSPDGIFLTHAHIGHYTGLMQFGKEAMNGRDIPVYVMPRMDSFLRNNGPWSQLVNHQNIQLRDLKADSIIRLNDSFSIVPIRVPHRDEYSETVGFIISSPNKKLLFIPDINKWAEWDRDIISLIKTVDLAFLDGTFYQNGEIKGRDMSHIPHPFVSESMELFKDLPMKDKAKIYFIHFNHTNPLLRTKGEEKQELWKKGFKVANQGELIAM